jgi:hypothetical protein
MDIDSIKKYWVQSELIQVCPPFQFGHEPALIHNKLLLAVSINVSKVR